jgi:hypothetical protein
VRNVETGPGTERQRMTGAAAPTPCQQCSRPMDAKRRCWRCCERLCEVCGRPTWTAFIALCRPCEVAAVNTI